MKRKLPVVFLLLFVALLGLLSPAAFVRAAEVRLSSQRFSVDGKSVDLLAFNVDGSNYVMLRSLAAVLNKTAAQFSVEFITESDALQVTTGASYPAAAAAVNVTGAWETEPVETRQTVLIDGQPVQDLVSWNIAGNNYFRLAELARYLGYRLQFSAESNTVDILTEKERDTSVPLVSAASYLDVLRRVMAAEEQGLIGGASAEAPDDFVSVSAIETEAPDSAAEKTGAQNTWSGTNVQVEGIDEGDIVKTDGAYIYVLNGENYLTILRPDGRNSRVLSHTEVGGFDAAGNAGKYPLEMFVSGDRLAILSVCFQGGVYGDGLDWGTDYAEYTAVDFYDVSNRARPVLTASLGQDGALLGARLLDGRLILTTKYGIKSYVAVDPATYVPRLYTDGRSAAMAAESIWFGGASASYVVSADYSMEDGALSEALGLLGNGDTVYMSGEDMFVLGSVTREEERASYTESVYTVTEYSESSATEIYRFDLREGLALAAAGSVPGYLDSRFAVDRYDGTLRLVTTQRESSYKTYVDGEYGFTNYRWDEKDSTVGLCILDDALNTIGSLSGLAEGEEVYAVRYDGDIVYFCTSRSVDPLFAVDLTNPAAPRMLSALKLTGFSEYLHPWTENRLFGFGLETEEETGLEAGLKLVMFDTSDKTNVRVENSLVLDADYSEALYDHRAFLIDPEKNVIGFVGDGDYYLYSYYPEEGFVKLAHVTFDAWESSARGLWIGDSAYIIGSGIMAVMDLPAWSLVRTLSIAP